jgi:DNA primase
MGKPYIDFTAVKASVTMTQVLEHYGLLASMTPKKNGEALEGPCPIHKGTSPDQFKVSIPKNCWNCFSECKCGGNVLDFVAKMEDCDAQEAAIRMNAWFKLGLDKQPPPPRDETSQPRRSAPAQGAQSARQTGNGNAAEHDSVPHSEAPAEEEGPNTPLKFALKELQTDHPYVGERGLTPETAAEFGLGYCKRGTMASRIVIPIHNTDGKLVGYAGRWPGEPPEQRPRYKLPEGFKKMSEVFNLHRAMREAGDSPLIVVEGFFDVMKLWQLGWRRAVSLMGSHLSATHERLLADAGKERGIILLFDEDDAGRTGRAKALLRLATKVFVRVAPLPREGVQPDHLTPDELHTLLA